MLIIHKLDDMGFKADTLEDLKKQIEDYYSACGLKPKVIIDGDKVTVDIDTDLVQQAHDMFEEATQLCNRSKFDEAMVLLEKIEKLSPRFGDVYRNKAQIYLISHHDNKKAMDACIEALRCDPKDVWALTLMGNILASEEDNDTAMSYYRKALEYNPESETTAANIAMLETKRGNYDKAIEISRKLVDGGSTTPATHYGLLVAYMLKNDLQTAFEVGVKALKETTDRPENPDVKEKIADLTYRIASDLIKSVNKRNIFLGIKESIEDKLTMPLRVEADNNMDVYGRMEYGPARQRDYHVLRYRENAPANAFHTIIHELMHLDMITDASKVGKHILFSITEDNYKRFRQNNHKFLTKIFSEYGIEANKYVNKYFNVLALQVMNTPLDLFVEQRIYDRYKVLHPFQFVTLYKESKDYLESIASPMTKNTLTPVLLHIPRICNMVNAIHIERLYGIESIGKYEATQKEIEQAKDLYDEFLAYKGCEAGAEYEYLEYFIQSLGVEDYFVRTNEKEYLESHLKGIRDRIGEDDEVKKANEQFAKDHPDDASSVETMMMSMYMLDALRYFDKISLEETKKIAQEIAFLGLKGINPNVKDYKVPSIDKTFGGYQLLAYYYVSWAIVYPERIDALGLPFSNAYELALKMFKGGMEK